MITVKLNLGIICGENKRILEEYAGSEIFRQRKNYDEYYIDAQDIELDLDLHKLMVLSESFRVQIYPDYIEFSEE